MAILVVKVEDTATLKMNEFFDYNGMCYALSCLRTDDRAEAIELEDFYDCTVFTNWIEDVPVIFMCGDARGLYICGWYRRAKVYRHILRPTLFLEGNITARAMDAVLLKDDCWIAADDLLMDPEMLFIEKNYAVIETDDPCYEKMAAVAESQPDKALPVRYELFYVNLNGKKHQKDRQENYAAAIEQCMVLAQRLMQDECEDISEIKALRMYAEQAVLYGSRLPDGYYYKAMAEEQLGFVKEGLKSVNKALAQEPDAADIMALKANLLLGLGKYKEAAALYQESYDISGDESYLLTCGKVWFLMGDVDGAYEVYRKISDKQLLEQSGINLKDMERRWPFVAIRGLKKLLKRN